MEGQPVKTVGDAIAEGFDQLVIYWAEPTRHGTERTHLSSVSIETELDGWSRTFAAGTGHPVTGASITRPRLEITAPMDHDEVFLWGVRAG